MTPKLIETLAKNALPIGIAIAAVLVVVAVIARKAVGAAADTAAGLVTGENAITRGTAYEGAGVLGTLGAVANAASGGSLQTIGEKIVAVFTPSPGDAERYDLFYGVLFPDGQRHAVRASEISKDGVYMRDKTLYLIGYNQANERIATPL